MSGDDAVGQTHHGRQSRGSERAGVADPGDGSCSIKGLPQIAGGTVVPLAEGGGNDENAR